MTTQAKLETGNRWGRILENSFDEIYVFDAETLKFIQVSRGALKNLGYSFEEIKTLTPTHIKPDLSPDEFSALLQPLHQDRQDLIVFETRHQRKDGSLYPVEVRLQLAKEERRPVFIAIILDITERKLAEQEIRKREQRFYALAKISPVGIFRTDAKANCVYVNERWLELAGLERHQALGKGWTNAVHPQDREWVFNQWYLIAESDSPFCVECRFQRPDGTVTWLLSQAAPELDSDGQLMGYVGTITDITQLKQTETALARTISEWIFAMDQFEEEIVLIDLDQKIVRANKPFCRSVGLPPEQLVGRNPGEILHPDGGHENCRICVARLALRDDRVVFEPDDPDNPTGRPLEKMVRVIRNQDDEPQSVLVTTRDLSRQRIIEDELREHRDHLEELVAIRTRELEISNKELESYSYSIAHDLRAPLRSIAGFSQIVMNDAADRLTTEETEYLQRVINAGKHMSNVIDDILELSRVSRAHICRRPVNLSQLAESCIERLQKAEPKEGLETNIEPDLKVQGDDKLINIIFDNLLGNAWKYTGKTENPRIEFGMSKQNGELVFYVKDNGIGFDMAYADKLFGVFQRLHSVDEFEGSGIGLATVQRIVERHGGRVWANAKPNDGATFYFTLS